MKKMNLFGLVLSSVLCASLAGCGSEPLEDGQASPPDEASMDRAQEPDTQTPGIADQAQEVAKLHMKAEDGTESDFLLPDGGAVKVTNEELGIAYRLTGKVIDAEHITVTVEQFNDIELTSLNSTDVLYLDRGRESHELSAITPFSIRLLGLESHNLSAPSNAKTVGENFLLTCCVTCGGWKLCCTPKVGKCCKVSSSCGFGCTVCN